MKTYTPITPQEAMRLLADAGQPLDGFAFSNHSATDSAPQGKLTGAAFVDPDYTLTPFRDGDGYFWRHCARVTETALKLTAEQVNALGVLYGDTAWLAMDANTAAYVFTGGEPICLNERGKWNDQIGNYTSIPMLNGYFPADQWQHSCFQIAELKKMLAQ